ncbi:MAG: RnfABCDGE type electron transport complex subunit D [Candidatus Margulisbacteria bacterium]|nr:RnfABCDGE type electron transport complex subunit D [Candidatus Margulisiibacteriota bacterium]
MSGTKLIISHAPHIKGFGSVPGMMYGVILALLPASLAGVIFFGLPALMVIATCVVTAVVTEWLMCLLMKKENTVMDGSAAITGLLLALTISPLMPLYMAAIGSVVAIAIGKVLFGGLGYNIFNPALVGRGFLVASFPTFMKTWKFLDATTTATPLTLWKFGGEGTPLIKLFIGNVGGCIGETSALALLIGGAFLIFAKIIDWRMPAAYVGTVAALGGILWLIDPAKYPGPLFQVLAGGLLIGAFFMATDLVTTPVTRLGTWIFGIGAGIIVIVIRAWGGLPEGVMFSILLMNALTPLINRYTRPKIFGKGKKK